MKNLSKGAGITIIACIILLLSSCGGTKLSGDWKDSAYERRYVKNVLVVGISQQYDRKRLEDAFVKKLQEHRVNAVSLSSIPLEKKSTMYDVKAEAVKLQCDAVLKIQLISISEKEERVDIAPPPEVSPEWSYSFPIYMLQTPPTEYEVVKEDIVIESSLYDTSTEKLIWRVRSETIKHGSIGNLIDSISKTIIEDLHSNRLIR
jgi:hypothetical protein